MIAAIPVTVVMPHNHQQLQYNRPTGRRTAIAQLVLGILCFVVGILLVILRNMNDQFVLFYHGIWSGVIFIIAGAVGIVASKPPPPPLVPANIRAFFGMSITSIVISFFAMWFAAYDAMVINIKPHYGFWSDETLVPFVLVILSIAEMGAAIASVTVTGAAICCPGCCGCQAAPEDVQVQATTTTQMAYAADVCAQHPPPYSVMVPPYSEAEQQEKK